jgi:cytoskeletal protein CcmA (bactofilin family)
MQGSSSDNGLIRKLEAISSSLKTMPSILANDLMIEGEILSSGIVEIEGNIRGTVRGNSVIVREDGFVCGTIIAESLSIRGKFEGTIKAKNISISSKANVNGTIEYDSLSVEDGACIDGQFKRLES